MDLYYATYSPPSRAVLLTADYMGLSLNLHPIDVLKGEHLTPEYEKINYSKQIPALVDGDFKIAESRAIMSYLADKYGKPDSPLISNDPCEYAIINQMLNFDQDRLYAFMKLYYFPVLFKTEETHSPEKYKKVEESFGILEKILENRDYVAGQNFTLADIAIITTVTFTESLGFNFDEYPNIKNWIDRVKELLPGYEKINIEGLENFKMRLSQLGEN